MQRQFYGINLNNSSTLRRHFELETEHTETRKQEALSTYVLVKAEMTVLVL